MKNLAEVLKHIIVPLATPFNRKNQDVDYGIAEALVEHLIGNRLCDSILVSGTTGEFNTLSFEERVKLLLVAGRAADGRVPMIAGTGAASTRETVLLTQKAEELGYDCAMIIAPYYCRPTQEEILEHFKTVAKQTGIPIMLYNIPLFTGVNIDPGTVAELAELDNILGIKDEAGVNPTQMTEYAGVTPDHFTIYNGDDIMVLCGMAQGAAGVVSGGSHIIGAQMRRMIELFLAGRHEQAREIHMSLDPLFKALPPSRGVNPIPALKAAIEMVGIPVGPPRLPLLESSTEHKKTVRRHLERLGVLS